MKFIKKLRLYYNILALMYTVGVVGFVFFMPKEVYAIFQVPRLYHIFLFIGLFSAGITFSLFHGVLNALEK